MKNILLAAGLACVPSFSLAASDCYIVAGKYQETAAQGLSTADHVQAAASAINAWDHVSVSWCIGLHRYIDEKLLGRVFEKRRHDVPHGRCRLPSASSCQRVCDVGLLEFVRLSRYRSLTHTV